MFWNKKNENRPMGKQEAMLEYKKRRNHDLGVALFGMVLLGFGIIVENNPAITDETLQNMAGIIGSVRLLLTLYIGIDFLGFLVNTKRYNDLAEELGVKKRKSEVEEQEEETVEEN